MVSFLDTLRDRRLVQWALAYLAGAWLVLQVLDVLADVWGLSVAVQQGIQLFLGAGFLVALVLAWYHGEKGRQRVSGPELLMIAALLVIAGGVLAIWRGRGAPAGDVAREGNGTARAVTSGPQSIAVLSFADLSPAGDQEYFADGIAEEILNALARIPGLRVAARTSAFSFKGSGADVREIGERLGVRTVLEGSVRTEGDRVRITVQLIDVTDGFHLWSDEYDREMESVFAIQEDIAQHIATTLQVELGSGGSAGWASGTTPEAYRAYLRGRHDFNEFSQRGWRGAEAAFGRALEIDSTFAPAQAGLAATHTLMWFFGGGSLADMGSLARAEATRALELDEGLAQAHWALGLISLFQDWDWRGAERELLRALELDPNDPYVRHSYADLLTAMGNPEEGLRQVRLGREADPLSLVANATVVSHLTYTGRHEEAIAEVARLRELFPDRPQIGRTFLADALWRLGRYDEALEEWGQSWPDDLRLEVERALDEDGPSGAMQVWAHDLAQRDANPLDIATCYARAEDFAQAMDWLENAYDAGQRNLILVTGQPEFQQLHGDPRFQRLLERMGLDPGESP